MTSCSSATFRAEAISNDAPSRASLRSSMSVDPVWACSPSTRSSYFRTPHVASTNPMVKPSSSMDFPCWMCSST